MYAPHRSPNFIGTSFLWFTFWNLTHVDVISTLLSRDPNRGWIDPVTLWMNLVCGGSCPCRALNAMQGNLSLDGPASPGRLSLFEFKPRRIQRPSLLVSGKYDDDLRICPDEPCPSLCQYHSRLFRGILWYRI
jgi:hypothetical protein